MRRGLRSPEVLDECLPCHVRPLQGLCDPERGSTQIWLPGETKEKMILGLSSYGNDAEALGVTFGYQRQEETEADDTSPEDFFRLRLRWGTGAALVEAKLDLVVGTGVVVVANTLNVWAERLPPAGADPADLLGANVSAMVGYGGTVRAIFTDRLGSIAADSSAVRSVVPAFADGFVLACSDVGGAANVTVLPSTTSPFTQAYDWTAAGSGARERHFPLAAAARFVDVENTGEDAAFFEIIYSLTL